MSYCRKEEPGFLIMYDLLPIFQKMSAAQVGRFVMAMGEYAHYGVEPDFSDDVRMDTLWFTTGPFLARNKEHYKQSCNSASYAGWCSSLASAEKEYLKIPKDDYIQARELYEDYLSQLPDGQDPQLFNDWLIAKRHQDEADTKKVSLPWETS